MWNSGRRWIGIQLGIPCAMLVFGGADSSSADTPVPQVMIEARIVEVSRNSSRELGFDWDFSGGSTAGVAGRPFSLGSALSVLESDAKSQVLAAPRITTISGEQATIEIGGEIPFETSESSPAMSFEPFELRLDVVPEVTADGRITMTVRTEASDVDASAAFPVIETRAAETKVALESGQSIALGGLFGDDARADARRFPVLGDVPVLGRLFENPSFQTGGTNLVVFVSPTLVPGGNAPPVQIQTRIIEVNRNDFSGLGIDWSIPSDGFQTDTIDTVALLAALEQMGGAEVVSNPSVTTLSGNPATIQVGAEVPVPLDPDGTKVRFENFGVELDLTPVVVPNSDQIRIEVNPTISEFDTSGALPTIDKRSLTTSVLVNDGETVVLGGLFQQDNARAQSQVPALGNIPGLGSFFRNDGGQTPNSDLFVFVTPTLLGEYGETVGGGGSGPAPAPKPTVSVSASGGYFHIELPSNAGNLGVYGVGNEEEPFLSIPTSIDTGGGGLDLSIPLPQLGGWDASFTFDGWYAGATDKFNDEIEAQPGVENGITFWKPSSDPFDGISQPGSGLDGSGEIELDGFQFNPAIRIDVTPVFNPVLDRTCDSKPQLFEDGAPWSARPSFFFEGGVGFGYLRQQSWSEVRLTYQDVDLSQFDIRTRNEIDLEEWNSQVTFKLDYSQPIPGIRGLTFVTGAGFGLGYRNSDGDGEQRNQCDVRQVGDPNTNQCDPGIQDFQVNANLDESGFDWSFGTTARIEYDFSPFSKSGLTLSLGYDFGLVGVSRFRTPTNLEEDGSPRVQHTQQPLHHLQAALKYSF